MGTKCEDEEGIVKGGTAASAAFVMLKINELLMACGSRDAVPSVELRLDSRTESHSITGAILMPKSEKVYPSTLMDRKKARAEKLDSNEIRQRQYFMH